MHRYYSLTKTDLTESWILLIYCWRSVSWNILMGYWYFFMKDIIVVRNQWNAFYGSYQVEKFVKFRKRNSCFSNRILVSFQQQYNYCVLWINIESKEWRTGKVKIAIPFFQFREDQAVEYGLYLWVHLPSYKTPKPEEKERKKVWTEGICDDESKMFMENMMETNSKCARLQCSIIFPRWKFLKKLIYNKI